MRKKQENKRKRHCYFCLHNIKFIDYKDTSLLKKFLSSFAKIVPRKRSGVCMSHQREMSAAVKQSRIMALLPFVQS